jgi:beta-mannanase
LLALLSLVGVVWFGTAHAAQSAHIVRAATENRILLPMTSLAPDLLLKDAGTGWIALGVYRPVYPNDTSSIDSLEGAAGRHLAIVHWFALWGGWKRDFNRADLDLVSKRGSTPMITWEPWSGVANDGQWTLRDAILSGKNDAYIESWARGLSDYGKPVLLRFAHEMHNSSYPWALGVNGNTAVEYVAAWQRVRAIFARYPTNNVRWIWNPNTMGDAPASEHQSLYRSLYPGDAQVDLVGLDVYNTGPNLDWGAPRWRPFGEILGEPYAAITAVSARPLILPEIGSAETGGSKPAWIADALSDQTSARFPRLRAMVWFDISKEERWEIRSSAQSLQAWVAGATHALFASDASVVLSPPAP